MNYCSECGFRLEKQHNFCPNCGTKIISSIADQKSKPVEELVEIIHSKIKICQNCGEENSAENNICSGCGVLLTGNAKVSSMEVPAAKKELTNSTNQKDKEKRTSSKDRSSGRKETASNPEVKELNSKKVIMIGSFFGVLVLIILLTSGVFDNKVVEPITNQTKSTGVDLSRIKEINELEEKLTENPDDLESLLHLAHLQNDSKLFEKAIQNYKKYLDAKPENADARVDMGICFYNLGDYPNAILEMESAIKYQPSHQIAHLNLGIVNLTAGNLEKSKEWLRKAIELNPESEVAKRAQELLNSH